MDFDRLFDLAIAFQKTKLWKRLSDTELFAFQREDGETCYCCVTGQNGQHLSLSVYAGAKALDSYRAILEAPDNLSPAQCFGRFNGMDCIQCSFEEEEYMPEEQLRQLDDYARRTGASFSGKNPYPCLMVYRPHRMPCPLAEEADAALLCEALVAALDLNTLLRQSGKTALGLRSCNPCQGMVPLVQSNGLSGAEVRAVELPEPVPVSWPAPAFQDELKKKRLSRLNRKGYWECAVVLSPQSVEDMEGGAPLFPHCILFWDSVSEMISVTDLVPDGPEQGEKLLECFCDALLHEKRLPTAIHVRDQRTRLLLADLAQQLGIALTEQAHLEMLEDAEEQFYDEEMTPDEEQDQLAVLIHLLSEMPVEALATMPGQLREQLMMLDAEQLLPADLSRKLAAAFQPKSPKRSGKKADPLPLREQPPKKRGRGKKYADQSLVISVSLGTGCYRHIRISAAATLLELSDAILEAFCFDDDHMHMFCMDNQTWHSRDAYFSHPREMEEPQSRSTGKVKLGQLELEQGQKFRYIFDFGDEWNFQCRVLRLLDEDTQIPVVVRRKGDAPEQYPDWDDDDDL